LYYQVFPEIIVKGRHDSQYAV